MEDYVLIDESVITEPELRALVENLAGLKHADVDIHVQWRVSSDDSTVLVALDALFGCVVPAKIAKEPGAKRIYKAHAGGKGQAVIVSKKGEELSQAHTIVADARPAPISTDVGAFGKQIRAWEIHIPGKTGKTEMPESITIDEKNLRLVAGAFETGTLLRHPKAGFSRVTGEKGTGQGMESIGTTEAIKILEA